MGRLGLRAAWQWPEFDIVHLNEIQGGTPAAAHLLEFDTVHGRWDQKVEPLSVDSLRIGDKTVTFSEHATPGKIPWRDLGSIWSWSARENSVHRKLYNRILEQV